MLASGMQGMPHRLSSGMPGHALQAKARPFVSTRASHYYLGLDFGTSGARAVAIDDNGSIVADVKTGYGGKAQADWAQAWDRCLHQLLSTIPSNIRGQTAGVAFDGTSATAMLVDKVSGRHLAAAKMYNEVQPAEAVTVVKAMAPPAHTTTASTSTLCKLVCWHLDGTIATAIQQGYTPTLLHQADWLASLLHGQRDVSDWNNALKLGYDPQTETYPDWMMNQPWSDLLPSRVVAPGSAVGTVTPDVSRATGLPESCVVAAGTTDSIAAFLAAEVTEPGEAVTSLGSTMAIKMLSTTRVDDAAYGVYSHRLAMFSCFGLQCKEYVRMLAGNMWLVGGASNTGGAVLRSFFNNDQLAALTEQMDIDQDTGLDYYPLTEPGERFPINDPALVPRLQPRPDNDAVFLQGMLESMSRIEADAYSLMHKLGSQPAVTRVLTAGGGAVNPKWTELRRRAIGVPVIPSRQGDACYGAALLARQGAVSGP